MSPIQTPRFFNYSAAVRRFVANALNSVDVVGLVFRDSQDTVREMFVAISNETETTFHKRFYMDNWVLIGENRYTNFNRVSSTRYSPIVPMKSVTKITLKVRAGL